MSFAAMMLFGFVIDLCLGWPRALFDRIGHPVTWLGALISGFETRLNTGPDSRRFWTGAVCTLLTILAALIPALAIQWLLPDGPLGWILGGAVAWPLIATRAMHDHVVAVARPLVAGNLPGARLAVSMIVGRDPAQLDSPAIARAATESLAENTSDGIVAPVFWGVVAGLPGIAAYKAINTLDSMIGHRKARYEQFGKCAALLDDLANLVPARLTGLIFALASLRRAPDALRVMWQDAGKHRSPNAGWPEGAMAGALGIRLSGPRIYGETRVEDPWLNAHCPDPAPEDLNRALSLYRRAMACLALALLALSLF